MIGKNIPLDVKQEIAGLLVDKVYALHPILYSKYKILLPDKRGWFYVK